MTLKFDDRHVLRKDYVGGNVPDVNFSETLKNKKKACLFEKTR